MFVCEQLNLTETKNFLLKALYIRLKVVEIVHWDQWIVPKNAMEPMNSSKNKLNSKKKTKKKTKKKLAF